MNATSQPNKGHPQTKRPPKTLFQQVIVFLLIIGVGVLFGMQPVIEALRGGRRVVLGDIGEDETQSYFHITRRIQEAINPDMHPWMGIFMEGQQRQTMFGPRFDPSYSLPAYAMQLAQARIAEREGLMPKGDTLEAQVHAFLATERQSFDGRSRRYGELLAEAGNINRAQVVRFVAVRQAVAALRDRYTLPPVLPSVMGEVLNGVHGDQVQIRTLTIPVNEALMAGVRDQLDDDALHAAYTRLRDERFLIPAQRRVTLLVADSQHIAAHLTISAEDVVTYYENQRDSDPRLANPAHADALAAREAEDDGTETEDDEGEEADDLPPAHLPLAEVEEYIRETLAARHAQALATRLTQQLIAQLRSIGGDVSDLARDDLIAEAREVHIPAASDPRLEEDLYLEIISDVLLHEQRGEESFTLVHDDREFGAVEQASVPIFRDSVEPGLVSIVNRTSREGVSMVLRVDDVIPSDYRPFSEVRDEVADYSAGRRAYEDLLAALQDLAQQADALGADGLHELFSADAELVEHWGIDLEALESREVPWHQRYQRPGVTVDETSFDEPWSALGLIAAGVQVVAADATEIPSLRLVQAIAYRPAEAIDDDEQREQMTRHSRDSLIHGALRRELEQGMYRQIEGR